MQNETELRTQTVNHIAGKMMAAARTAPKGKGMDNIEIYLVNQEEIENIATKMEEIGARSGTTPAFIRDAKNIRNADALILMGTRIKSLGLAYCSLCGYSGCDEKNKYPDHPCAFNTGDLGIAIGSAASIAMDSRIDNRIMYTVGMAVKELKLMGEEVKIIYGIPLSCTGKNIFFDRK